MNKQDKDWLFSKIETLKVINEGIFDVIDDSKPYLTHSMCLWIENFIKEIHKKTGMN